MRLSSLFLCLIYNKKSFEYGNRLNEEDEEDLKSGVELT